MNYILPVTLDLYKTNPTINAKQNDAGSRYILATITAKATEVTIAQGYHSGSGKVKIATAEQNKIITGNIKAGVTILGVAGKTEVVDTSSGDAVAGDILNGKKAWVDGSEVIGTLIPVKAGNTAIATAAGWVWFQGMVSYTKVKEITVNQMGTYRIVVELGNPSFASSCYGKIYKNGSAYGPEWFLNNDTVTQFSADLFFDSGDKVQLYGKESNGGGSAQSLSVRVALPTATVNIN